MWVAHLQSSLFSNQLFGFQSVCFLHWKWLYFLTILIMLSKKPVPYKAVGRWVVRPERTYLTTHMLSWLPPPVALASPQLLCAPGIEENSWREEGDLKRNEGKWRELEGEVVKTKGAGFSLSHKYGRTRAQVIRDKIYVLVNSLPSIRDLLFPAANVLSFLAVLLHGCLLSHLFLVCVTALDETLKNALVRVHSDWKHLITHKHDKKQTRIW